MEYLFEGFGPRPEGPPAQTSFVHLADDTAAGTGQYDIWHNHSQSHQDTLETQSKPLFDSDDWPSPSSSTHSSIVDLSSPAGSDSDFDIVESSQDIPQAEGAFAYSPTSQSPSIFPGLSLFNTAQGKKGKERALPGSSNMDAGSTNDYDDSDWQQAGHNATQQDLAGPGLHGYLECTVDSAQKEGEGTQNAYVSYLVTTNVS